MKCMCGANLKKAKMEVEFFGIDFGIRDGEICAKCGAEYLDNETLKEVEKEVKKRGLFGLEKKIKVTKSGNSIVIRIPPEIANFTNLKYQDLVRIFPVSKQRIELEVEK